MNCTLTSLQGYIGWKNNCSELPFIQIYEGLLFSLTWYSQHFFHVLPSCFYCINSRRFHAVISCVQVENNVYETFTFYLYLNIKRFAQPISITTPLCSYLSLYSMRWKFKKWSSTHQDGLFMVVMAAFLNGCYGYLHTRYGVQLRLAVLLSLMHSPHFCLITDLFHWWRCEASPRSQWGKGGEVCWCLCLCVCVCMMMMMMMGHGKALGNITLYLSGTLSATLSWCDYIFLEQGNGKTMRTFIISWPLSTRQAIQGYYLCVCVNHVL